MLPPSTTGLAEAKELWQPSAPEKTQIHQFKKLVSQKYKLQLETYHDLYKWSVTEPAQFWEEVWHYTAVKAHSPYSNVLDPNAPLYPKPRFFEGSRLNFAENLLFPENCPGDDQIAIIGATESDREFVTWKELRERVRICANAMRQNGVTIGDRIAGFVGNHVNAVVVMLAATSIGAFWTAISPDSGVHAVLERLVQIQPKLLFADNGSLYNGKVHPTESKVVEIVAGLPSLERVVILQATKSAELDLKKIQPVNGSASVYKSFIVEALNLDTPLKFELLEPDHPVYILYSSGTTGAPKPIVHGALGTLIQHKKEHVLHSDIRPGDRLFYYTTTTWMMWHWLVSALASGATIIVYDGSPFRPLDVEDGKGEIAMARLIDELQITHFGTSAKYLSIIEQASLNPRSHPHRPVNLEMLRAIFSTAAPLAPSTFDYIYSSFHPDIMLGSITGGTDIISLFGASCPILPVHRGEIQCRGLGMAVATFDYAGNDITATNEPGDLVCTKPFPAQPVMFWPPGPEGSEKYRKSYFDVFGPHIWHHGDFLRVNPETGGLVMLGRSDGVLKPAGVRFGSAEIYNVILKHFSSEIEDSLCIGRRREGIDTDETVVLFVKLAPESLASGLQISQDLIGRIQAAIRKELSARHVPGIIDVCPGNEIPVTSNGKKVENAVKQILCGLNIKTSASVANAACLEWYRKWAAEH
ncbi:acetoacetyl-CoA synthase [Talaromyces proteolyticus]|uniref:Acetoacetyl-CoA synthase n=1 Tax=Talaromyces proteolyticus TaxID=1131652 RepID=A0AAD4L0R3_9EURO|nr:acetoacetyl-CoA synthase [Talaromyces proteolyticus]KAH8704114.1 acetoacetyl-CoA synthase [Talaromyces proteolyticus]